MKPSQHFVGSNFELPPLPPGSALKFAREAEAVALLRAEGGDAFKEKSYLVPEGEGFDAAGWFGKQEASVHPYAWCEDSASCSMISVMSILLESASR